MSWSWFVTRLKKDSRTIWETVLVERRQCDRLSVEYSATFSAEALIRGQGLILELSVAGCRARSTFAVKKDDRVRVLIDVPRYEDPLQISLATVRWTNVEEFGLEFLQVERADRRRLLDLLHALKAARRGEKGR
jgi:PilZ domain-containing protein